MSSAPKKIDESLTAKSSIKTEKKHIKPAMMKSVNLANTKSNIQPVKKHIEPPISLVQSLKNLDNASAKRTTVSSKTKQEKPQNHETTVQEAKKSAAPNILTNSTITGFLSNNPKYTIDSVTWKENCVAKKIILRIDVNTNTVFITHAPMGISNRVINVEFK